MSHYTLLNTLYPQWITHIPCISVSDVTFTKFKMSYVSLHLTVLDQVFHYGKLQSSRYLCYSICHIPDISLLSSCSRYFTACYLHITGISEQPAARSFSIFNCQILGISLQSSLYLIASNYQILDISLHLKAKFFVFHCI